MPKVRLESLIAIARNNKKILENYFFMTILQVLNSFFYLLIYPYIIRTLGADNYGLFVYATSIATYFIYLINFGFEMPATKAAVLNVDNPEYLSKILSCIFTAKFYLFIISFLILFILLCLIPTFNKNFNLFLICFLQAFSFVLFPQWYFQAIQKMKVVTYIQLGLKLLSLPFIFLLIKSSDQLNLYALIVSFSNVMGGIAAFLIVYLKDKLKIKLVRINELRSWFKDALPFFLSTSAGTIKEQSIIIIIGSFFGMKHVAIYDLANKIIIVPRTVFMSINGAIFPKLMRDIQKPKIKKIINIEMIISLSVTVFIVLVGKFIVNIIGGEQMAMAYPLSIFLSITVMTWLVVGAYISFVFIPNNKYFLVTKNQLVALGSFALYTSIGLFYFNSILVFGGAIAISGLTEILYCNYLAKKYQML